jgi:hypothetical protein
MRHGTDKKHNHEIEIEPMDVGRMPAGDTVILAGMFPAHTFYNPTTAVLLRSDCPFAEVELVY